MPKVLKEPPTTNPAFLSNATTELPTSAPPKDGKPNKIVYPTLVLEERSTVSEKGPIYEDTIVTIMALELESAFKARMVRENPGSMPEQHSYREEYMFVDDDGNKVRCWKNFNNRPSDPRHIRALMQTIAHFKWAGPLTIPGETVNGSTICLARSGKYGADLQTGQHSLVALWLFCQAYKKNPRWYYDPIIKKTITIDPRWQQVIASGKVAGPCIETILIKGVSENPEVIMTQDNIKPRTLEDVLYTSPLFRGLVAWDRREHAKILSGAAERLWDRTGAQGYKTHAEMLGFTQRHMRLMKCAEHLYGANKPEIGNKSAPISSLRIKPGVAAALCYLMGSSATTENGADDYRNGVPPNERDLDWSSASEYADPITGKTVAITRWDKAKEFWAKIGAHDSFKLVRRALGELLESTADSADNMGMGGREEEKLCVLQGAWEIFLEGREFTEMDIADGGKLSLNYVATDADGNPLPEGQLRLIDQSNFGGIDLPGETKGQVVGTPPQTDAELEAAKEEARRATAEQSVKDATEKTAKDAAKKNKRAGMKPLFKEEV